VTGTPDPIVIDGLGKRFGRVTAVDGLNLRVQAGTVYGFLGLNGAGKTTTIRMLLDLLRPSAGRAAILGHDCRREGLKARAAVGYLPGELRLYPDLSGRQALQLLGRLSDRFVDESRQRELLDRLSFSERDLARPIGDYSAGMKRKIGIVQAFQSDPELLILDEPTEGLDPLMQVAFYDLLDETRRRGRTVFMSSHVLSEVDRVCDRIGVLRDGRLVLEAPVDEVRRIAPRTVIVSFMTPVSAPGTWPDGVTVVSIEPTRWQLRATREIGGLVSLLSAYHVVDIDISERTLEDVVIAFYRGQA
jgi:ABC-2 type transport system ATP-binding protein